MLGVSEASIVTNKWMDLAFESGAKFPCHGERSEASIIATYNQTLE